MKGQGWHSTVISLLHCSLKGETRDLHPKKQSYYFQVYRWWPAEKSNGKFLLLRISISVLQRKLLAETLISGGAPIVGEQQLMQEALWVGIYLECALNSRSSSSWYPQPCNVNIKHCRQHSYMCTRCRSGCVVSNHVIGMLHLVLLISNITGENLV